ncbi:unnamed protein product [Brassicogethes aeneus]|uniref:Peptide-N(4)-(N-acetyl-beta-glucosaminyl)asparagine amidase n=1 Tax=Brassicogethes aeneus TaxID=1431903 RepID=A0A9P0B0F0_BRAAE|nr:unnamed protein product [Brassicogethes aeneus]
MSWASIKEKLKSNKKEDLYECIRILLKISTNIINDPGNEKVLILKKSNATLATKVFSLKGGFECLQHMGFKEDKETLIFTSNLNNLKQVKQNIDKLKEDIDKGILEKETKETKQIVGASASTTIKNENIKKIILPPLLYFYSNSFLRYIEAQFHQALAYEDKELQERATKLIPVNKLELNATEHLRKLQTEYKKKNIPDLNISIQDMLILELLEWFKEDFFAWVDTVECSHCSGKTKSSHMSQDPKDLKYTDRVEIHKCITCGKFSPFPRYNDLNILLETRKGRCGEWAKIFTLLCRAMGWDARFIEAVDEDHVWTEVYSFSQKRWLHCDPCENICDKPLIYEAGWNKNLSYVLAFSAEEVQDVTWRYSGSHDEVRKRRKKVPESELIEAMLKLRDNRQKNLSKSKKEYLTRRTLFELAELLVERKASGEDAQSRISGAMEWKMSRCENVDYVPLVWKIRDVPEKYVTIRYSPANDSYEYLCDNKALKKTDKWTSGIYFMKDVFRKEEKDWKQVYLCRKDGSDTGVISWKFELTNKKIIDKVDLNFDYSVFESGEVKLQIIADNIHIDIQKGKTNFEIPELSGQTCFTITATMSGGKGDHKWQHAQLFRQPIDNENYPFIVKICLKDS